MVRARPSPERGPTLEGAHPIVNEIRSPETAEPDTDETAESGDAGETADSREVRVGRWPILLALAVAVALYLWGGLGVLDALFTTTLLVLLPIFAAVQLRVVDLTELPRTVAYANSIATMAILGSAALALGLWGPGPAALGFTWPGSVTVLTWSLGLTALGMAMIFGSVALRRSLGSSESAYLRHLLPRTGRERATFALLSLSAGTGEEVVFRSYLIAVLAGVLGGPVAAAAVAALVFAAVHAYQGPLGMVRTALLGLLLAAPLLAIGSIWPAMVAHTAIDLLAGLVFATRLIDGGLDEETRPNETMYAG